MKLRYSCSTLATTFERGVVPALHNAGITHTWLPDGAALDLSGFRVHAVHFAPAQRHAVELPYPAPFGPRCDVVETENPAASHNVLVNREVVADISIGQFTGDPQPVISTRAGCVRALPGEVVVGLWECSQRDLDDQQARDGPQFHSLVRAVVQGTLAPIDHPYCEWCFGDASLSRCSRCKGVHNCGQVCQRYHWKAHKPLCSPA